MVALLSAALGSLCFASRGVIALDFRAFYCAGLAWDHNANPYHTEPLYACEVHQTDGDYSRIVPNAALPAPLPSYDIAGFGLLARMPFGVAKVLWGAMLSLCIAISVFALARLTQIRLTVIFAVLATALVGPSLALGQIVPLYLAAASAAMMFAYRGKYGPAAVAAAASLVEPHLGLPLCLGLVLWIPQSRATLAIAAGVLVAIAIASMGVGENLEYITRVLPLHALSELPSDAQLSLSVLLHGLGVGDASAIRAGAFSYAFVSIGGACLGGILAARLKNAAFAMAVPAATCLIGGSFLHGTDLVAAIPLVLLLFVHAPSHRHMHLAALILLSAPFWAVWEEPSAVAAWFAFAGITASYVVWQLAGLTPVSAFFCGAALFVGLLGLNISYHNQRAAFFQTPRPVLVAIDRKYPEASWAQANWKMFSVESGAVWLTRASTWLGLGLAAAGALGATSPKSKLQAVS